MTEELATEILRKEEELALQQLCLDRHLPVIANQVEKWKALHLHNIKINALFEENFTTDELVHYKQQQFKFLQLWRSVFQTKATYCYLCENFRSTQNRKAETFTRQLSISSLKEIIKGILNANQNLLVQKLDIESILDLMIAEGLLKGEIETIEEISNEQKRCKYIAHLLKYTNLICFQKFILLLSKSHYHHRAIAEKFKKDLEMNEIVYFLPSMKFESNLDDTLEASDEPVSSRKRKREERQSELTVSDPQQSVYELSRQFADLLDELVDCLHCCEVPMLITKFNVLMADHASKIPFFPKKVLQRLYKCKTVEELFLELSPYISWQRLHVLQLVVDASKCEKAKELLANFKSKIDESRSIMEYIGPPSKRIVPARNSSEALFCTKSVRDNMSLDDSNKIKKAIADSTGVEEYSIELTATQNGSIILYWLVVRSVIGLVIDGVHKNLTHFYNLGIVEVCIDPGIVITTVPDLRVRSLAYLTGLPTEIQELASAITKLHLDLLTHLDSPSLLPLEELKLKVEDLQVKCHMLSYKAEGNEMLLKEKLKQLEDIKKTADEAKLKLSQIQSDYGELESKLSLFETENASLKLENKTLASRVFTTREQIRQKESELQKANENVNVLLKEVTSLKEKVSTEKKADTTTTVHSSSVEDLEKHTSDWKCSLITGFENVRFGRPDAIAIGPNHELLICDYKHQCVFILDSELNLLKMLGTTGDGRLTHPNGIAIDQDGIIAVSDYRFHQVKKFSLADGSCLSSIGAPGQEDGNFDYPRGLAFSSDGLLYVMDWGNSRIQVFNKQNEFAFKFGTRGLGPSEFDHPTRIAMDGSDNVYVANYNSSSIGIFTNLGKFITSIPTNKPFAIAVTPTGYIFADDNDKNLIKMWNPKHQLIGQFGKEGDQKGEFNSITDMAIGKNGLYVVDAKNKRLQFIEGIIW